MPFELGLAIGYENAANAGQAWCVCESEPYRIQKSLSDLNGVDVYIHDGTIAGVFRAMSSAFIRSTRQPTVPQMKQIYRILRAELKDTLRKSGSTSPYNARVFRDLSVIASAAADDLVS